MMVSGAPVSVTMQGLPGRHMRRKEHQLTELTVPRTVLKAHMLAPTKTHHSDIYRNTKTTDKA